MNIKKKEGGFYAAKVRLFLNEYNGISLEEFCRVENVSYTKMCNCLGRASYQKQETSPKVETQEVLAEQPDVELPQMELRPLVFDSPCEDAVEQATCVIPQSDKASSNSGYLNNVRLKTAGNIEITVPKCPVKVLVSLLKEMEGLTC